MNNLLETNEAEALKLVAEVTIEPRNIRIENDVVLLHSGSLEEIYNPLENDAQAWQLMQVYRDELLKSTNDWHTDSIIRKLWNAAESNRALVQAYMELKGIGK